MSSGFITESEIAETRRKRQEEWEKVRTEDQPIEAPEEPFDSRPLYQRLEEQKLKRDAEYEETHRLKNMIRGLDDDEVGFLDLVEQSKAKAAQDISNEERREMKEFRERVSTLAESEEISRIRAQLAPARSTPKTTATKRNKLQGMIVRKRKASDTDDKSGNSTSPTNGLSDIVNVAPKKFSPALRVAGVLPGLGHYSGTSTDTDTDTSEDERETPLNLSDVVSRVIENAVTDAGKTKQNNVTIQ